MTVLTKKQWKDSVQQIWDECIRQSIEDQIKEAVAAEREAIAQSLDKQADLAADEIDRQWAQEMAAAVRARGDVLAKLNQAAEANGEEL